MEITCPSKITRYYGKEASKHAQFLPEEEDQNTHDITSSGRPDW